MGNGFTMGFGGGYMWLFWLLLVVGVIWALNLNRVVEPVSRWFSTACRMLPTTRRC